MKTILVAVDFSDVTDAVLDAAYAQAASTHGIVRIVHAAAPDPEFVGYGMGPIHEVEFRQKTLDSERSRLEKMANWMKERGVDTVVELLEGPPVDVLLEQIKKHKVDMVIVGSHGHGALFNLVVGSVTQALLHRAMVPVLVVPSKRD